MTKLKNFQHRWLFNPNLSRCPDKDIWSLCYVDNEGIFGALCLSHSGMYPQSKQDETKNRTSYKPETIRNHFIKAEDTRRYNALHISRKRTSKTVIILCQRTSGKGEGVNASYEKIFQLKKSRKGYACLTDEVTDISNAQNLLTFIRFYDMEKGITVSRFVNTCDILRESETMSADSLFYLFLP